MVFSDCDFIHDIHDPWEPRNNSMICHIIVSARPPIRAIFGEYQWLTE